MNFILDFQKATYPYFEELNEGVTKHIPPTKQDEAILDIGAGRGILSAHLKKLGYKTYIIEANPSIAEQARHHADYGICADLHDIEKIKLVLQNKKFKYIIFSDVLEHVFDPVQVLRNYQPFLSNHGKVIVSLPNVANWLVRLRLMFGVFNYEMTGVMDRTHIRFFTFKSAKKMLETSTYIINKIDSTPFIVRAFLPIIKKMLSHSSDHYQTISIIESPYYQFYTKYIYPIEYGFSRLLPSLFSFRIILVASNPGEENGQLNQ